MEGVVVVDSVTRLAEGARLAYREGGGTPPLQVAGRVVVGGSHCGVYAAYLVARAQARAVVLNDAGIGRDAAGVAGLELRPAFLPPHHHRHHHHYHG